MAVSAYTIVSRAYVPQARVLARTFFEHHPDGAFWALLVDDVNEEIVGSDEPFDVLRLNDLEVDPGELHRMAMLFGNRIIAAIKPWVFDHLLGQGCDSVIYIDSDFMIFGSLAEVDHQAREHGVVVVPHVLRPVPRDGLQPDDTTILGVGTFNAGFFAVGRPGREFLEFFKERLRRECHTDVPRMRVNEQRWLDFVPALFDHCVIKDPGIDAAPWNIHERNVSREGGRYLVGGKPLRALHFSGFDPRIPAVMSARDYWESPRVPLDEEPELAELYVEYARLLYEHGFDRHHRIPFAFDYLADGTPISGSLRTLYAQGLREAENLGGPPPPDPFDPDQVVAFRRWATDAYSSVGERAPARLLSAEGGGTTAVDWSGRMLVGEAGRRSPVGVVHLRPGRVGTVLSGPNALEDAGHYRVRVELFLGSEPNGAVSDSNVVLIEVMLDGHLLACTSAYERGHSAAVVDFVIPSRLQRVALSAGVQVRITSRAGVSGTVDAVAVERLGDVSPTADVIAPADWLPAMGVGDVGERTASDIVKPWGRQGVMAEGPGWRLGQGRYRAQFRLRSNGNQADDDTTVVAAVDVVVHGYVLAHRPVTRGDLETGQVAIEFEVGDRWATDRYTRVDLRVRARAEVELRLESVMVHTVESADAAALPMDQGSDWLPAMWVTEQAVLSGTEIHSTGESSGPLAYGPGWRVAPGAYRFDVTVAPGARSVADATGSPEEQLDKSAATIQVLLDGSEVTQYQVFAQDLALASGGVRTYSLDFIVEARRVPAPLHELSPLIDLVLAVEGGDPIRFTSVVLVPTGAAA